MQDAYIDSTKNCRTLDLEVLQQATFHDKDLMQEILQLFVKQLESTRETLALEPGPEEIRNLAHRLKGAALAVGALSVAEIASAWENNGIPKGGFAAAIAAHEAATREFRAALAKIAA